jgi:hypothetical protein
MTRRLFLPLVISGLAVPMFPSVAAPPPAFEPFFQQHCYDCHDPDTEKGGLDLTTVGSDLTRPDAMRVWVRVHDRVSAGEMPPQKRPQPPSAHRDAFLAALSAGLTKADQRVKGTVLRRLNRTEYENTLNDLLGIRESLAELLPEDGKAHGFDNVGEALDVSAMHLERYMEAAGRAVEAAIRRSPRPEAKTSRHGLADGKNSGHLGKHWHQTGDGAVVLFNSGNFPRPVLEGFRAAAEGMYRVRITGHAHQSEEPVAFDLWQGVFARGGTSRKAATLAFGPGQPQTAELEIWLKQNATFVILPDLKQDTTTFRKTGPAAYQGRGLAIAGVEIEGPVYEEWPGRGHELLFGGVPLREAAPVGPGVKPKKPRQPQQGPELVLAPENPAADAERLLRGFLPAAFRRPVDDAEVAPLLALVTNELDAGASFEAAMKSGYVAALCSPGFLFFREPPGALDDHALASRLSYAFWNTAPDRQLLELARAGTLARPAVLREQTERLLGDARSARFVTSFVGQWLNLREIDFTTPDAQLYPEYDEALKDAMVQETTLFFGEVLENNLSVLNFIHSDWTMLNERLAAHYRIPGVRGAEFRKVALQPEHQRGGVLTHASVLKVSANGTTTSPVVRGTYVLERILGIEPPPPPPSVPGVEPDIRGTTTLREQLAKHRAMESCNSCHRIIDPPGFALESYDVMGGFRDRYRSLSNDFPLPTPEQRNFPRGVRWRVGPEVDPSGETPDGQAFANLAEYKKHLLAEPGKITRAMAEKLAVYSTGRAMGFSDRATLDGITRAAAAKGHGFRDLIHEVVQSEIFRNK